MLSTVLSELTIIRKMLYDYIIKDSPVIESRTSVFNNTSPKLKELMKILSHLERNENCLVYVNHQTTAKLLYHYIKVHFNILKLYLYLNFVLIFVTALYSCKQTRKYSM